MKVKESKKCKSEKGIDRIFEGHEAVGRKKKWTKTLKKREEQEDIWITEKFITIKRKRKVMNLEDKEENRVRKSTEFEDGEE